MKLNKLVKLPLKLGAEFQRIYPSPCDRYFVLVQQGQSVLANQMEMLSNVDGDMSFAIWANDSSFVVLVGLSSMLFYSVEGTELAELDLPSRIIGGFHLEDGSIGLISIDQIYLYSLEGDVVNCWIQQLHGMNAYDFISKSTIEWTSIENRIILKDAFQIKVFEASFSEKRLHLKSQNKIGLSGNSIIGTLKSVVNSIVNFVGKPATVTQSMLTVNKIGSLMATIEGGNLAIYEATGGESENFQLFKIISSKDLTVDDTLLRVVFLDDDTLALLTFSNSLLIMKAAMMTTENTEIVKLPIENLIDVIVVECKLYFMQETSISCFFMVDSYDLYQYYLNTQNYQLAIEFGLKNGIDLDIVYQNYFKAKVEKDELDLALLDKITDKKWVLETCTNSFFSSTSNQEELLKYGLSMTDRIDKADVEAAIELMLESDQNQVIGKEPLTLDLFLSRFKILEWLDKLKTFESITDYPYFIQFGPFSEFVQRDIVHIAADMAETGKVEVMQLLFTRHGRVLLPYRLSLLQLIPYTTNLDSIGPILPVIDSVSQSARKCKEIPYRKLDWTESQSMREFMDLLDEPVSKGLSKLSKNEYPETVEVVEEWYQRRILDTERRGGLIETSIALAKLAIENGIRGLNSLLLNLNLVEFLLNHEEVEFSLIKLHSMDMQQVVSKLLDAGKGFEPVMKPHIVPFLQFHSALEKLSEMLLVYALANPPTILWILEELQVSNILSHEIVFELLLNFAYSSGSNIDLELLEKALTTYGTTKNSPGGWDNDGLSDLEFDGQEFSNDLDLLRRHIKLAKFFAIHGENTSLKDIRDLKNMDCGPRIKNLLLRSSKIEKFSDNDWKQMLLDLLDFEKYGIFTNFHSREIHSIVLSMALRRSRYQFAQAVFYPRNKAPPLPAGEVELLVLDAAQEFFDNDTNGNKNESYLKEALTCCGLLKPSPAIVTFQNLIEATHLMCHEMELTLKGTRILPIQIRLSGDKVDLLCQLIQTDPILYHSHAQLFQIAGLLVEPLTVEGRLAMLATLARASYDLDDSVTSYRFCLHMIELMDKIDTGSNTTPIETLLYLAAQEDFEDLETRLNLASITIKYAPLERMDDAMNIFRSHKQEIVRDIAQLQFHDILEANSKPNLLAQPSALAHDFYKATGSTIDNLYFATDFYQNTSPIDPLESVLVQKELQPTSASDLYFIIGKQALRKDIPLAISLFINSKVESKLLFEFFETLEQNSTTLTIASYLFSLRAIFSINDPDRNEIINAALVCTYETLPTFVMKTFESKELYSTEIGHNLDYAKEYNSKLKSNQTSSLRKALLLLDNTNEDLLNGDQNYRRRKILDLAKTQNEKQLDTAIMIANEDGVPVEEVIGSQLAWIFTAELGDAALVAMKRQIQPRIINSFEKYVRYMERVYQLVLQGSNTGILEFYDLLLVGDKQNEFLSGADRLQLVHRKKLLAKLEQAGISKQVPFFDLLRAKIDHSVYGEIWNRTGIYLGIAAYIELLREWASIICLDYFSYELEFSPTSQVDIDQLEADAAWFYLKELPLESLDSVSVETVIDELLQILKGLKDEYIVHFLSNCCVGQFGLKILVKYRIKILREFKMRFKTNEVYLALFKHAEFLEKLTLVKGEFEFSSTIINSFDQSFGSEVEFTATFLNLLVQGCDLANAMEIASYAASLDYDSGNLAIMYEKATKELLLLYDFHKLDEFIGKVAEFKIEKQLEIHLDKTGWGMDDVEFVEHPFDERIDQVFAGIRRVLDSSIFGDDVNSEAKVRLVEILEKYFDVQNNEQVAITKISSLIHSVWGLNIESDTVVENFQTILANSQTIIHAVHAVELLLEFSSFDPSKNEDLWKSLFKWLIKQGYLDTLICCFILVEFDYSTTSSVFDLLELSELTNHFFILGMLANHIDFQRRSMLKFISTAPNKRAYQFTYQFLCASEYFNKLSAPHKFESLEAIFETTNPFQCQILANILMSTNTKADILRKYHAIHPNRDITFRKLCQLDLLLASNAQQTFNRLPYFTLAKPKQFQVLKELLIARNTKDLYNIFIGLALHRCNFADRVDDYISEFTTIMQ